jgi:hypothetical protein
LGAANALLLVALKGVLWHQQELIYEGGQVQGMLHISHANAQLQLQSVANAATSRTQSNDQLASYRKNKQNSIF